MVVEIDIDNIIQHTDGYNRDTSDPIVQPYDYLSSIPSNNQNVRNRFLVAFNSLYYHIEQERLLDLIGEIISIFHNSSLLIDDIEDSSLYRRGLPAAHTKYGIPLTINCGNLMYFIALQKAQIDLPKLFQSVTTSNINMDKLKFETSLVLIDEMLNLHHGQGLDIYWRDNFKLIDNLNQLPSIEDYLQMIKDKTGGIFRLSIRLLKLFSPSSIKADLIPIANLLGIIYQIRDDYLNLTDPKYSHMKGLSGEDLIEGKLSLPILHCLINNKNSPVQKLLTTTNSAEERKLKVEEINDCIQYMQLESKSLEYTRNLIKIYEVKVKQLISESVDVSSSLSSSLLFQIIDGLCAI
ncbi:isoprenoid synthase domain-containing protein [Scheffersomyces coipomensis]|uniref:isoprenoid synthase domain-containing protein n=1 Tax=Scheffersomyces coipomensis TaxID=1788519 RepID=UPI00315D8BAD